MEMETNRAFVEKWEIPQIELYMDQVTTFMENKLSFYKRNEEEKILTKTMINNYAKERLFPAPVKKKYGKEHIMLLIIIYHLKSVLPISDIKRLLEPVNERLNNKDTDFLEEIYDKFVLMQKNIVFHSEKPSLREEIFEEENMDKKEKEILDVLVLSVYAEKAKREAEKIIDRSF